MRKLKKELKYRLIDPGTVTAVALDIGVEHTGYSIWSSGLPPVIGQIENAERLLQLKPVSMAMQIASLTFPRPHPVLYLIEDYAFGRRYYNMLQPETIGALKMLVSIQSDRTGFIFLSPSTIKKQTTGNGRATKAQVKRAVKALGYSCRTSHEADSVAIYLAYKKIWDYADEGMFRRAIIEVFNG